MASPWPGNALLTLEQFLLVCPEFADTDYKLIDLTLQEAAEEMDPVVWDVMLAAGHRYLTAHKLCMSPMGQNARLIPQDGDTTYSRHFEKLVRKLPLGVGVAGTPLCW